MGFPTRRRYPTWTSHTKDGNILGVCLGVLGGGGGEPLLWEMSSTRVGFGIVGLGLRVSGLVFSAWGAIETRAKRSGSGFGL